MKNMKQESEYWSPHPLIDMKDINGNDPVLFLVDGNRTSGKTFGSKDFILENFLKKNEQFIWLKRFGKQLNNEVNNFYKDLNEIKYTGQMRSKVELEDSIEKFYYNEKLCGFCVAINSADNIKSKSSLFSDVTWMILDEFQSETTKYCTDEVSKLISIYTSIARGKGSYMRPVKVLLVSNSVSPMNPYYYELEIAPRLKNDTKFLKGDGFVLQRYMNKSAALTLKTQGLGYVFKNNRYNTYASGDGYYIDDSAFLDKPSCPGKPYALLRYNNQLYGFWDHTYYYYISHKYDPATKLKYGVTATDHGVDYFYARDKSDMLYKVLMESFSKGLLRFQDLDCKNVFYKFLRW